MSTLRNRLLGQFGHPTGRLGALAGRIMARRTSNRKRNASTLELLDIRPGSRVLEIGYGPGWALARAARLQPTARLVGIDHSEVMLRQASRRNAGAIRRGQVSLLLGTVEELSDVEGFDRVYAVNVAMFWPDPVAVLRDVAKLLVPGGVVALTHQPRGRGATGADARAAGEKLAEALRAAGFESVRALTLASKPVDAACVLGSRP